MLIASIVSRFGVLWLYFKAWKAEDDIVDREEGGIIMSCIDSTGRVRNTMSTADAKFFFWLLIGVYAFSMVVKMAISNFNMKYAPRGQRYKDYLYGVLYIKPIVALYHIAFDLDDPQSKNEFTMQQEWFIFREVEVIFEGLFPLMIQTFVFFMYTSESSKFAEFVSILMASFTVGYGQAQLSYYIDVDPTNRQTIPSFHGYIGNTNEKRLLTQVFQTLFTFCFALSKAVGASIGLAGLGSKFMAIWVASIFVIFIVGIKLTIGRVRSWLQFEKLLDYVVTTFMIKVAEFMMAMAAPNAFCRIPLSVGGRVSAICLVYSFAENLIWLGLVSQVDMDDDTSLSSSSDIEDCGVEVIATDHLLYICTGVGLLCLGALWIFLIPNENKHTFTEVVATKDFAMSTFWNGQCNELKAKHLRVFCHKFRPPVAETKEWLRNWDSFYKSNDPWFVHWRDNILHNLDTDYLGEAFVIEFFQIYFWNRNEDFRKYRPLVLNIESLQPPTLEVVDWIDSNWEKFHEEKLVWFITNKSVLLMILELYHAAAITKLGNKRIEWGEGIIKRNYHH